jgi:hypothetical protein
VAVHGKLIDLSPAAHHREGSSTKGGGKDIGPNVHKSWCLSKGH